MPNLAEHAFLAWLKADDERQQADYRLYRDYYDGRHNVPLTPRQQDYLERNGVDFRFNFLRLPVNVLVQRLNIVGFDAPDPYGGKEGRFREWWNFNRMDAKQRAIHRATAVDGDSYALVEWDAESGKPVIHHERAYDGSEGVKVTYATSGRRQIAFASKRWREVDPDTNKTWKRLNIYTPDEVRKYRSDAAGEYGWTQYQDEGDASWPIPWPIGVIPVIHFRHDDDGGAWGFSELDDLIPVQNALNKSVLDMLEGADKTAYQIITLSGGKADGIKVAPGQVLYHPAPDASWGSIQAGDIEKLIRLKNDTIVTIAQMSQVPLSYFQVTGQIASAETQRADDTGLVSKAESEAVNLGNSWEDVMWLCHAMEREFGTGNVEIDDISTQWANFERVDKMMTEQRRAEIVQLLTSAGASIFGAVKVAGYSEEQQADLLRGDYEDMEQ